MGALSALITGGITYWQTGSWRDAMLTGCSVLLVDIYIGVSKLSRAPSAQPRETEPWDEMDDVDRAALRKVAEVMRDERRD